MPIAHERGHYPEHRLSEIAPAAFLHLMPKAVVAAPEANRPEYPGSEQPFARLLQGPRPVERRSTSVLGCEPTFARNGEAFLLALWARERAHPAPGRFE